MIETPLAVAYGPQSATINGEPVTGNGQAQVFGRPAHSLPVLPAPIPLTVGVRQGLRGSLDVSADVGWMNSGLGLRARVPYLDRPSVPVSVSAGFRTGKLSAFTSDTYEGSLALEAYPEPSPQRHPGWHLVTSVGISAGVFQHQLLLPTRYDSESDAPHGFATLTTLRPEVRLQVSIGTYLRRDRGGLGVTLSPWFLLSSSTPTSSCSDCNGVTSVTDVAQTWGLALTLSPSFGWSHAP